MHVSYAYGNLYLPYGKSVKVSQDQYRIIVEQIRSTFQQDQLGQFVKLPAAYGLNDAFFKANGTYHCFNTCNSWTGRVLKQAGVRVPWFSPLPKTVFLWLPD